MSHKAWSILIASLFTLVTVSVLIAQFGAFGVDPEGRFAEWGLTGIFVELVALVVWLVRRGAPGKSLIEEEEHWSANLSQADCIFAGISSLEISKVATAGTTREIDEILDFRIANTPDTAKNLVELFRMASGDSTTISHEDRENVREFVACYFVTSNERTVRALLLDVEVRTQLWASALADPSIYVRVQLVRALAETIEVSDEDACFEFARTFIGTENVLTSGFAYVFSMRCDSAGVEELRRGWETGYQQARRTELCGYLSNDSRRLRYVAAVFAGYVDDEETAQLLDDRRRDEYDYVRASARDSIARRDFRAGRAQTLITSQ